MDLHGKIINLQVKKRKQNVAIDEALKSHKNLRDIMVAIYTRAHRDARHAAAEIAARRFIAADRQVEQVGIETGDHLHVILQDRCKRLFQFALGEFDEAVCGLRAGLRVVPVQTVQSRSCVGVKHGQCRVFERQVAQYRKQNGVFEDVGMIAGMEGVTVTEHRRGW